jgi:hypothetical protein
MKRFLCNCLILSIALLNGCCLCRQSGKKEPAKTQLVLSYWDESGGGAPSRTYDTKMMVFIDGEMAAESDAAPRYERKELTMEVEPGDHVVIIEGYGLKDGSWEKRTREKGYSTDHRLEKEFTIEKGQKKVIKYVVPDSAQYLKFRL